MGRVCDLKWRVGWLWFLLSKIDMYLYASYNIWWRHHAHALPRGGGRMLINCDTISFVSLSAHVLCTIGCFIVNIFVASCVDE